MLIPKTKYGKEIQGTLEKIEGIALINGATRNDEGELVLHYVGETQVLWDTQGTACTYSGHRLYVCSDGHAHAECDLVWEEEGTRRECGGLMKPGVALASTFAGEEDDIGGCGPSAEFTRVRHQDSTVYGMLEHGSSLEDIIVQLVDIRADLEKRLLNVELILPRKFTDDKGQTWVYRCPPHLVPDIGVAVTSEPELLTALRRIVRADTPRPLGGIADEGERQRTQFEFDLERAEAREYARAVLRRYKDTMELVEP